MILGSGRFAAFHRFFGSSWVGSRSTWILRESGVGLNKSITNSSYHIEKEKKEKKYNIYISIFFIFLNFKCYRVRCFEAITDMIVLAITATAINVTKPLLYRTFFSRTCGL